MLSNFLFVFHAMCRAYMQRVGIEMCSVERGVVQNKADNSQRAHMQVQWVPFLNEMHVLGRVGYDLASESADFHFVWHDTDRTLFVRQPYRWLVCEEEYEEHKERFVCVEIDHVGAVPYYRYPHTKDGTTLIEILKVLFREMPCRIMLL